MRIGVPKEIKNHEYRVGFTPESAAEAVHQGNQVIVQSQAGAGIGAEDDEYRSAGAEIVDSAEEIFATAEMIVKVKEPQPVERAMLREGQILPDRVERVGPLKEPCSRASSRFGDSGGWK